MNALDVILIVCAVVYAVTGYQQGFLVGSCATIGLAAGGLAGVRLSPWLLTWLADGFRVSVAALVIVLLLAFVGQAVGAVIGQKIRRRVVWRPARIVDALTGAALSVAAMLVIAWVLGVAASGAPLNRVNAEVRGSTVLGAVDDVMPDASSRLLSAFDAVVGSSDFPRYLQPFEFEQIKAVRPPPGRAASTAGVQRARHSVVKILGDAQSCGRTLEGSGFVYAPHRVMTNAHVVAGVTHPLVRLDDTDHTATVVYYDPDTDIAVLAVPDLRAAPLSFATSTVASGTPAAVLGYPEDGPFDAESARIRSSQQLNSPDIYGNGAVVRQTYAIYSQVREGNSGGPLVSLNGRVLGVVFAASLVDSHTAYTLTSAQVSSAAEAGIMSRRQVDTGGCAL